MEEKIKLNDAFLLTFLRPSIVLIQHALVQNLELL